MVEESTDYRIDHPLQFSRNGGGTHIYESSRLLTIPPDGWVVASKDTVERLSKAIQEHLKKLGNFDFDKLPAFIFNPDTCSEFKDNINVILLRGKWPIEESDAETKLAQRLQKQYSDIGKGDAKFTVTRKTFGSHITLVAESEINMEVLQLRQWQVVLPTRSHTLIVTCTAMQSSFDQVAPVFTKAIETITYSDTAEMPLWLNGAIFGAGIGGLYGLFKRRKRNSRHPRIAPDV